MANLSKSFWKGACGTVVYLPACFAGIGHGVWNVLRGEGSFGEGCETGAGKVLDAAVDFGEEHADELTRFVRDIAVGVLAGKVGKSIGKKS